MAFLVLIVVAAIGGSATAWGQADEYVGRQPPVHVSPGTDSSSNRDSAGQAPTGDGQGRTNLPFTGTSVVALCLVGLAAVVVGTVLVAAASHRSDGACSPSGDRPTAWRARWGQISLLAPVIAAASAIAWLTMSHPDGPRLVGRDAFVVHLGDLPVVYFAIVAVVLGRPWFERGAHAVRRLLPGA